MATFEFGPSVKDDIVTVRSPRDWDSAVAGFEGGSICCVTYLASVEDIIRLFEVNKFEKAELVLGYGLTGQAANDLKRNIGREPIEVINRILGLIESSKLALYVPKATDHSKFYFLEYDGRIRVLVGSYNLTGSRNTNRLVTIDFSSHDRVRFQRYTRAYEQSKKGATFFMGDLLDLVRGQEGEARDRRISEWVKGLDTTQEEEGNLPAGEVIRAALESDPREPYFEMVLPPEAADRRILEEHVAPFTVKRETDRLLLDKQKLFEDHGKPATTKAQITKPPSAWIENSRLIIGLHGKVDVRTAAQMDVSSINAGLDGIERYINLVDLGKTRDPKVRERTKATMYEALLYFFNSPFMDWYMNEMYRLYPANRKVTPLLRIVGEANCGKSQFVLYCLKLMTGVYLLPLHAPTELTKARAKRAAELYSEYFPLVYDDVVAGSLSGKQGEVLIKSWWEKWWRPGRPWPTLIFVTNDQRQATWSKEREKKLLFDVYFENNDFNRNAVNSITSERNDIYTYFTLLYFKKRGSMPASGEDPLNVAREVMRDLYVIAKRQKPPFVLEGPIEKSFDIGKDMILDLLNHHKLSINASTDPILVNFTADMQKQMNEYVQYIPGKKRIQGLTVVIETPEDFIGWLGYDNLPADVRRAVDSRAKKKDKRPLFARLRRK